MARQKFVRSEYKTNIDDDEDEEDDGVSARPNNATVQTKMRGVRGQKAAKWRRNNESVCVRIYGIDKLI